MVRSRLMLGRRSLGAAALLGTSWHAAAQSAAFPSRPLTIIVPFAPGGLADTLARLVAEKLRASLGVAVVVENRPGAGGIPGARTVAAAAPDGHTLLLANTNLAINPSLYRSLPYETETAFAPVIRAIAVPNVIVVRADVPARSLAELIALARQVEVLSSDPPAAMPQVAAGTLRALCVTSATRLATMPEVPTAAEAGLAGFEAVGWQGFVAPGGTPEPVIRTLNGALAAALAAPDLRERLLSQGVAFVTGSPAEFAEFLRQDMARWRGAVAASGARVE